MKIHLKLLSLFSLFFICQKQVSAQLIPDRTLGNENSIVNQINNIRQDINGGATRGTNLFHSFQEFNVNSGQSVFFNAPGINNIFTRVTGSNVSNIFGTLGVNGNANLFLINPNGIVFGQGARLDLNGSFTASTAEKIVFSSDFDFKAISPQTVKKGIDINFPISFGFGNLSQDILVKGDRNQLKSAFFGLTEGRNPVLGIQSQSESNLNLIAKNIILDGGILTNENGIIQLTAIHQGNLNIDSNLNIINNKNNKLGNIELRNGSLIDASATKNTNNAKGIKLLANTINLIEDSVILTANSSRVDNSKIEIVALESLNISTDNTSPRKIRTSIITESTDIGNPSNIFIFSPSIVIKDAAITSRNLSKENILPPSIIKIDTKNLQLINSGRIITSSFNLGTGADIQIDSNNINISGISPLTFGITSEVVSRTFGFGKAGNIKIATDFLTLTKGGQVNSETFSESLVREFNPNLNITEKGGDIFIEANNRIFIDGSSTTNRPIFNQNQIIDTSTSFFTSRSEITASSRTNLEAGNITIRTSNLSINNEGKIQSSGINNIDNDLSTIIENSILNSGGNITIFADSISLNNGSIETNAQTGDGGNINITTNNILLIDGKITANVGFLDSSGQFQGLGDGGNITIISPNGVITALDKSSITANATLGRGGNIRIVAAGLFTTPGVKIEAISQLGIDGIVELDVETKNENLIPVTRENYEEFIKTINLRCKNQSQQGEGARFGIKNVFPHQEFLKGGDWEINLFLATEEEALNQKKWNEVIVPNTTITDKNGDKYYGLTCANKIEN